MQFLQFDVLGTISMWGIRDPFSMLSHALGALLALGATVFLVRRARQNGMMGRAVTIYGASVVVALAASALFHYVEVDSSRLLLYKKIDHAAIFLVMAGTGTAIYASLESHWAGRLIAITWGLSIIGIAVKLIVWPLGIWETASMYLAVGWTSSVGLFVLAPTATWRRLRLFIVGALIFSIAAVVFATKWPVLWPGVIEGHEVFHVLVLIGKALHFRFIYLYCTRPSAFRAASAEPVTESPWPGVRLET